jgi:aspartate aminotransferase
VTISVNFVAISVKWRGFKISFALSLDSFLNIQPETMPTASFRSKQVPPSPFRLLVPFADQAKARGLKVYHLNIGQPDIETPAAALQKVKETDLKVLEYSPAVGIDTYRQKLVHYYEQFDIHVTTEQVLVTTGASEALQFLMLSCFEAGDEVIIPEPFYANYNGFAQMYGVHIRPITCQIENGFALPDADAFEAMITTRTRAILINNPNNPTGSFLFGKGAARAGRNRSSL